ncbi:hypothetical protein HAX54_043573 [Datura stramonium]|uniref:Uncharacterized protein n=1 Tax=Datura stramonium TaxID=4076 RepID=A0ABS8W191_DATST|nr:hypothetical protein [Datura stramonium]
MANVPHVPGYETGNGPCSSLGSSIGVRMGVCLEKCRDTNVTSYCQTQHLQSLRQAPGPGLGSAADAGSWRLILLEAYRLFSPGCMALLMAAGSWKVVLWPTSEFGSHEIGPFVLSLTGALKLGASLLDLVDNVITPSALTQFYQWRKEPDFPHVDMCLIHNVGHKNCDLNGDDVVFFEGIIQAMPNPIITASNFRCGGESSLLVYLWLISLQLFHYPLKAGDVHFFVPTPAEVKAWHCALGVVLQGALSRLCRGIELTHQLGK